MLVYLMIYLAVVAQIPASECISAISYLNVSGRYENNMETLTADEKEQLLQQRMAMIRQKEEARK